MSRALLTCASCLVLVGGVCALAAPARQPAGVPAARAATAAPVVNANCPVRGGPVDGKTFVELEGVRVGFCCPGCDDTFVGWTAQRKAAFIADSRAAAGQPEGHGEHGEEHAAHGDEHMPLVFAYYLPNCPVRTGEELDVNRAVVKEYEGRELRFCCTRCEARFDSDPAAALAKIDEAIIADQLPLYPLTTCLVMDGHEMDEDAINLVYKNRLVRFCCEGCIGDFEADPEAYLHTLDQAAADAQRESYPLTECVVAGHAVADGEHPTEVVVGGRLIRLCCEDCMQELVRNPAEYVKMVDEAREAAAR